MKKMKREMEPMVFRSFRTPGLKGQRATGICGERKQERGWKRTGADRRGRDGGGKKRKTAMRDKEHLIRNSDCNQESVTSCT